MRPTTLSLALLFLLLAPPTVRGDDVDVLVQQLASADDRTREAAFGGLLAAGERARVPLEGLLDPSRRKAIELAAPLRARIGMLIKQLGATSFSRRERASRELAQIGRPALAQLTAASRSAELEVAQRARRLVARLTGGSDPVRARAAHLQATLLLAQLGTRESIGALRHALTAHGPDVGRAADFALRAITGSGPEIEATRPAEQLARAWAPLLAKPVVAPTGPPTELAVQLAAGDSLRYQESVRLVLGFGQPGASTRTRQLVIDGRGSVRDRVVSTEPLVLQRSYMRHRQTIQQRNAGRASERESSMAGGTLELRWSGGRSRRKVVAAPLALNRRSRDLTMSPGAVLATDLPRGTFAVGQRRPLNAQFGSHLIGLLLRQAIAGGDGFVRYEGRVGRHDRYSMSVQVGMNLAGAEGGALLLLAGPLIVDPQRRRLVGFRLSGPLVPTLAPGARDRDYRLGEGALELRCAFGPDAVSVARERLRDPLPAELRARASALFDLDPDRRLAAVRALRSAGAAARPLLERLLAPAAPSPTATVRIAALLRRLDGADGDAAAMLLLQEGDAAVGPLVASLAGARQASPGRERRTRLLERIDPIARGHVSAALLLAELGTPDSVPALTHALRRGDAGLAAAADHALRTLRHTGPALAGRWWADRADQLAAWETHLEAGATPSPAGPPVQLALRLPTTYRARLGGTISVGPAGSGATAMIAVTQAQLRIRTTSSPRVARLTFDSHSTQIGNRDGMASQPAWTGKTLTLSIDATHRVTLHEGEREVKSLQRALLLPLAQLVASGLPRVRLTPGQSVPIPRSFSELLVGVLSAGLSQAGSVVDHQGRLTYLGRRDGLDRYALALITASRQSAADRPAREALHERSALSGTLVVDPRAQHVRSLHLAGPTWGGLGPAELCGHQQLTYELLVE